VGELPKPGKYQSWQFWYYMMRYWSLRDSGAADMSLLGLWFIRVERALSPLCLQHCCSGWLCEIPVSTLTFFFF